MAEIKRIIKLAEENPDFSNRKIGEIVKCSKNTVKFILTYARSHSISYSQIENLNELEIKDLFYPNNNPNKGIPEPDVEYCINELNKKHVTVMLLWLEYYQEYPNGLKYTQFKDRILKAKGAKSITAHFERKAGEKAEIDWSGDVIYYYDKETNEAHKCYVFVMVVGRSGYTYMEVFHDTKKESFFSGTIHGLTYFGAVPKMLVPDNDKSAVTHNRKYEIEFNRHFLLLADYYNTVVIPARVRKPKDKPLVENAVFNAAERELIGSMHNNKFYSFSDLSDYVYEVCEKFNNKSFSKKEGSRKSVFIEEDLPMMKPLPKTPYELVTFKLAKVSNNYHVEYNGFYYSVPYTYVSKEVELRINTKTVQIFYLNNKIAEHIRLYKKKGSYSTQKEHMPEKHLGISKEKLIEWGNRINPLIGDYLIKYFSTLMIEEQGYKGATGIIAYSKKDLSLLLETIKEAMNYNSYSYKTIKIIYERLEKRKSEEVLINNSNIRGEEYYKEKN